MRYLLIISLTLLSAAAAAQSKNPTTKKEVDDKIKQAHQQLDNLTPEQKKMMKQMGMSTDVPSMSIPTTDAAINAAVNGGAFSVPAKNNTLIAAIPQITLTASTVAGYVKTQTDYVDKGIASEARLANIRMAPDASRRPSSPKENALSPCFSISAAV